MKRVLVIVDMVNGFVNEGPLSDKRINEITPNIIKLIENGDFDSIIAFRDCHEKNDEEFKTYPPHCLKGTVESELIPELVPYSEMFLDMPKQTTNGFESEGFKKFWASRCYDEYEFVVTGCCTDICVKDFSTSLMRDIVKADSPSRVVVLHDCVSTFDSPEHDAINAEQDALVEMAEEGVELSDCESVLNNDEFYDEF